MPSVRAAAISGQSFDIAICGGGLVGLLLARQLRRELPDLSVCVIDRLTRPLPEACLKVGESSVELGSQHLERLGLREYLHQNHLIKFGLRFFPGGGHLPFDQRLELGPSQEPPICSYQMDRGILENDLRAMACEDGTTLVEGGVVRDLEVGAGETRHRLSILQDGQRHRIDCRWLVDATGRAGLLKRHLKLARGSRHKASSGWFRIDGRLDITDMADGEAWRNQPFADQRWRSTNHLLGDGYWVWIIPLPSGKTSIGAVIHGDTHDPDRVRTLDNTLDFLREHEPHLAKHLAKHLDGAEVLDFLTLKDFSYGIARAFSEDRWAIMGEAAAFPDPLYSPGTDFLTFSAAFTVELVKTDLEGADLTARVREMNLQYRALVGGAIEVYRHSGPVYDHPRAMAAKIYWDNFAYWNFPCQYYLRGLYRLSGAQYMAVSKVGARFVELSGYVQELLRAWALMAPEEPVGGFLALPAFPSVVVDSHLELQNDRTPQEAHDYMTARAEQGEQMVAELVWRLVSELGPERGAELMEAARVSRWQVSLDRSRLEPEALTGRKRRKALPKMAADLERVLGPVEAHPEAARARELVLEALAPRDRSAGQHPWPPANPA